MIDRWFKSIAGKPRGELSTAKFTEPSKLSDYTIENAWRDHFALVAREMGFKGSGRHFRRKDGEFVQAVNLQGSQYGGKFAVNWVSNQSTFRMRLDRKLTLSR